MSQYYYTVSSLPALHLDLENFPTVEDFYQQCEDWLSTEELQLLKKAQLVPEKSVADNSLLEAWLQWETGLRNELAKLRSAKQGKEALSYIRADKDDKDFTDISSAMEAARQAFNQSSPYQAEIVQNQGRWAFLDELEVGQFFSVEKLMIYSIKLQILQRIKIMTEELGKEHFAASFSSLVNELDEENNTQELE